MSRGKKPKGKHTLTLHFDSKIGIRNFVAWYLDGGGEQDSNYYSKAWGKDWMHVAAPDDACPKCEYVDYADDMRNSDDCEDVVCSNCNHKYKVKLII